MFHGASLFRNRGAKAFPIFVSIVIVLAISAGFMTAHQDWTEIFPNVFDAWSAWADLTYTWMPERAFAQSIPPTPKLTPAGSISDGDGSGLRGARILATFESDGRTYAAVSSSFFYDRGVHFLDLTDPSSISVVGGITHEDSAHLNDAWWDISIFKSDGRTYAAVILGFGGHIQILDLTDPSSIVLAGSTASLNEDMYLISANSIATFESDGRTYAAISSDLSIQILDLTDPYNIIPTGNIKRYDEPSQIIGASSIATFESDGHTYAAVGSNVDDAFQILDLIDPHDISVVSSITDNDDLYLNGVSDIDIFESDGRTYAAVVSPDDDGIQILDLTDPHNVTPAESITDSDDLYLGGVIQIDIFESDDRTYAAATSVVDEGVQILDLTDPHDVSVVSSITDNDDIYLDHAWDISTFESDDRTYAAITSSYYYNIVQILDLTDPHSITVADGIAADVDIVHLYGASDITAFESDDRTYAAVASSDDNGVQILDLTDPHNIAAAGGITSDDGLHLISPDHVTTFESGGHIFAVAASSDDNGVQILDLTDPHNIAAAGGITDTGGIHIDSVLDIATFESGGRTFATIASNDYDGVQILDLTDPHYVTAAGSIADDSLYLDGAWAIDTFESGGRTYAAVTLKGIGVQILDLTDPYNITPAGSIADDSSPYIKSANSIATFESDGRTYGAITFIDRIQIFDLTDPYNIHPAGPRMAHDRPINISTFESDGRTYGAVVSEHVGGVQVLDLTDPYNVTPAGGITDDDGLHLRSAVGIAMFESDGRTYGAVASLFDGIQILDLTDPYNITPAGGIPHRDVLTRGGASHIYTFESDGRTYGAVASHGGHVRILDLTDPYNITPAGGITDTDGIHIDGVLDIATFESGGRTYAAAASSDDDGVQILDLTDPYNITPAGGVTDDDGLHLRNPTGISTFESDGRTYAAVVSYDDDGVQILDLTDPYNITPAGGVTDDDGLHLRNPTGISTFESDGRTYAAAASFFDGIQIFDLTDPYNITPAGDMADTNLHLTAPDHITTFESDGRTYAAVISSSYDGYGIQILDLTNPYDITAAGYSGGDGSLTDITVLELDGRTYAAIALHSGGIHIFDLTNPSNISLAGGSRIAYGNFHGITSITTFELDGNTYVAVTSPHQGVQTLQLTAKEPDACVVHTAAAPVIPPEIAATGNRFAVDLYGQVSGDGDNVFFSPISAYVAFSMVGEAARGETASQLQGVFGFEPDDELRHNATAILMSSLNQPDPCATLQLASSLWLAEQFEPYDSYIGVVNDAYQADIETVDFMDGGVDRINGWASEKTQGKIPKVLDPDSIPENMTIAILNAIYFKGTWEEPFSTGNTHESDFWTGTQEVKADFMSTTTQFGYTESDGVQVLNMPYQGDRLSMLVMLPSDRDGLDNLEHIVTSELIEGWQESLRPTLVRVLIPKFEMNTHYNLASPLVNMGVKDVFDPWMSDLSGMAHLGPLERLYVNIAIQDAYVKVNEEGTEAAAVTAIGGAGIQLSLPPEPVPFIADHPFLFLIQDDKSGMILFMGKVSNPS